MPKMIFHYAGPIADVLDSGEKARVHKMRQAFISLGVDVIDLTGSYEERERKFREASSLIANRNIDFVYSESRTFPLRLSGPKHLPTLNSVDFKLFRLAKERVVPVGVFYRDIYWQYRSFSKEVGLAKHLFSLPFYAEELRLYNKCAKIIFTPSERFIKRSLLLDKSKAVPLPPGCDLGAAPRERNISLPIRLVYVGSIKPPIYDISLLLKEVSGFGKEGLELTIVTRQNDRAQCGDYYKLPQNASILSVSGDRLSELLRDSDISVIFFSPSKYREICAPVKLFEAIGYGLPVISYGDNSVSDYVRENDIGWIACDSAREIFRKFLEDGSEIKNKRENVEKIIGDNVWAKRAEKAMDCLRGSIR